MRVVVTGAAGFVGGAVARHLRDRGDDVVAPVRRPAAATQLSRIGATVVADDLSDAARLAALLDGADAAIHAAGSYRVGIRRSERGPMFDANVGTTSRFFDAATMAATRRVVYVSTVNVFGNTHGRIVDESFERDVSRGFLSWYDETKYRAHEIAAERLAAGAPGVIAMPSQVYGPGDHSAIGDQLRRAHAGTLRYRAIDELGIALVHVDDLAAGIGAALDRGSVGRAYVLAGPTATLGEAIEVAAGIGGHRPPRLRVPTRLVRATTALGPLIGQPNLAEVLSASAGVTYWARSDRAKAELGWTPRPIEDGLRDTFGAA
jgi:dihydroflavonol-4-reductase